MRNTIQRGHCDPIGATITRGGVNFCLFSRHASAVELLLFQNENDVEPKSVISLDPVLNRTYHYWHAFVPGITVGQLYGYRVSGLLVPAQGLRFDNTKVLLDPYGRCVAIPTLEQMSGSEDQAGRSACNSGR